MTVMFTTLLHLLKILNRLTTGPLDLKKRPRPMAPMDDDDIGHLALHFLDDLIECAFTEITQKVTKMLPALHIL